MRPPPLIEWAGYVAALAAVAVLKISRGLPPNDRGGPVGDQARLNAPGLPPALIVLVQALQVFRS
jgi:hypothetical protein